MISMYSGVMISAFGIVLSLCSSTSAIRDFVGRLLITIGCVIMTTGYLAVGVVDFVHTPPQDLQPLPIFFTSFLGVALIFLCFSTASDAMSMIRGKWVKRRELPTP